MTEKSISPEFKVVVQNPTTKLNEVYTMNVKGESVSVVSVEKVPEMIHVQSYKPPAVAKVVVDVKKAEIVKMTEVLKTTTNPLVTDIKKVVSATVQETAFSQTYTMTVENSKGVTSTVTISQPTAPGKVP